MLAVMWGLAVLAVVLWPPRRRADRAATSPGGSEEARGGPPGASPATSGPARTPTRAAARAPARRDAATVDAAADALVLCALAMRSGLGPVESLEAAADRLPTPAGQTLRVVASAQRWGQDAATAWSHAGAGWMPASVAWQAAERSGAAPAAVVLAAAQRMRREEASRVESSVQRAGVLLVLPLGACFLPGFVGTTVVPVLLHLARTSLGSPG